MPYGDSTKYAQQKIIDIVLRFAEVIGKENQVFKVILYGSHSRGVHDGDRNRVSSQ